MTRIHAPLALAIGVACLWLPACGGTNPPGPTTTPPRVTAITPVTGSTLGGTVVTITGAGFTAAATVTIGGALARDVVVTGTTALTATTAEHVAGAVDVQVTVAGQSASLPGAFTYVAPPPTDNQPPVITALTARGTREDEPERFADLDEEIEVAATVTDVETAPDKLQYQWTAPAGTFSGTGSRVTWRAPSVSVTPAIMPLTVAVIETYTATDPTGLPVTLQNKVTRSVDVNLHASAREIEAMATQFMTDFSKQLPPDVILRNFTQCSGRDAEADDIRDNQEDFLITSYTLSPATAQVRFDGRCAFRNRPSDGCAQVPVTWVSTVKATGKTQTTTGTDHLTAFYERPRWWLCDSDFEGANSLGLPLMR